VDPWGVSADSWESVEANLFAVSLFPYLAFLRFLSAPGVNTPPLANFAFRFLLAFVGATIPAGIYAKIHYGDILANVDWLHGTAESLLTVTNLLLVIGMRRSLGKGRGGDVGSVEGALLSGALFLALASAPGAAQAATEVAAVALGPFGYHPEPANALSLPTWAIHLSSVVEYLVAMGLIWKYADVSGNPRWKGLTWGMIPSHTSGITACTFHLFYNTPGLNSIVALQALLTVVGNTTCAIAAYRIAKYAEEEGEEEREKEGTKAGQAPADGDAEGAGALVGFEDLGEAWEGDSDAVFVLKLALWSLAGSALIKYGELWWDAPFAEDGGQNLALALAIIFVPTGLNAAKWWALGQEEKQQAAGTAAK